MKRGYSADVQTLFDEFAEYLILDRSSFLTSNGYEIEPEDIEQCFRMYGKEFIEGNRSFDDKIQEQFKFNNDDLGARIVLAHAQWLWAYSARDKTEHRKKEYTRKILSDLESKLIRGDVYTSGFGSTGQWHNQNKYWEILFNLILIKRLYQKATEGEIDSLIGIKDYVEAFCLDYKYHPREDWELPDDLKNYMPENQIASANVLLYIVKPDLYEPIASNNHKRKIVSSFQSLLDDEKSNLNTDEKIYKIREEIASYLRDAEFDYYDAKLKKVWNYGSLENDLTEIQGLEYKKAIILYGPPGTSKTYSAFQIAESLITKNYLKDKSNVKSFLNEGPEKEAPSFIDDRIHRLQLHQNYSYEDFIAGIRLSDGNTEPQKGYLFEVIEKAKKDNYPHILILDEINRVDLSQLFGEVFSAIENRDQNIDLSIGNFSLQIPENLYVIGTMNEIDFSLERVDFALRRRFLWYPYPFSKDKLREILEAKFDKQPNPENLERYLDNAEALNEALVKLPTLGKRYQVGHTFFAEIADVYKKYIEINSKSYLKNKFYKKDGPANVLWDISLEPMIRSFLGSMSEEDISKELKKLKDVFFNEG